MLAAPDVRRADVVEDAVEDEPEPARATVGDQAIERGLAAEAGIDRVEVGRVVLVRRRRREDGRQVDGVGAQGGDVGEVGADAVELAEGGDEDLVDDAWGMGARHGGFLSRRAAKAAHDAVVGRRQARRSARTRTFVRKMRVFHFT